MDEYGLTTVELHSVSYKDDQWVLASRYAQVAYWPVPKYSKASGCVWKAEDCGS